MAQIPYRANLSATVCPLRVADAGRTTIIPGIDQNYDKRVDNSDTRDAGIPQVLYMENVLPTPHGYQSVAFKPLSTLAVGGRISRNAQIKIKYPGATTFSLVNIPSEIELQFWSDDTVSAISSDGSILNNNITPLPAGFASPGNATKVSTATVRGICYLCIFPTGFGASKLYTVTFNIIAGNFVVTFTDVTGTVTGITAANLQNICGASNYLIATLQNDDTIYWSSTTTPTDFVSSLVSGAGSEIPDGVGKISFLLSYDNGFFVYCDTCVVSARYTGNSRYPWKFKPIAESGGYIYSEQAANGDDFSYHVGINNSGQLQLLSYDRAEIISPELTQFFQDCRYFDVFDYNTHVFTKQFFTFNDRYITGSTPGFLINHPNIHRISLQLNRYVFISYNDIDVGFSGTPKPQYQYCLIYDLLLKRIGKIKFLHSYIFGCNTTINFLDTTSGIFYSLKTDIHDQFGVSSFDTIFQSVLILGRFQLTRDRLLQIEDLSIECAQDSVEVNPQNFSVFLLPSTDGKNFGTSITPYERTDTISTELKQYYVHKVAKNWCIGIKGAFDINTVEMKLIPHGHS